MLSGAAALLPDWPPDRVPPGTVSSEDRDLDSLVEDFVARIPRRDSGLYQHPTAEEASVLRTGVEHVLRGRTARAAHVLAELDYRVLLVHESGRRLIVLAQTTAGWERRCRAWGLYALAPGRIGALIEVAHPLADQSTELVGLDVFARGRASALLVAGAHRGAVPGGLADVAHQADSVFHAVHSQLLTAGATRVLQPHGFDPSDHPGCQFDAVVSSGVNRPAPVARDLHNRLTAAQFASSLYAGGPPCEELAARTNVQGRAARRAGAQFVHLELAPRLRASAAVRQRVGDAALAVTRDP